MIVLPTHLPAINVCGGVTFDYNLCVKVFCSEVDNQLPTNELWVKGRPSLLQNQHNATSGTSRSPAFPEHPILKRVDRESCFGCKIVCLLWVDA